MIAFIACNGQTQKDLPKDKTSKSKVTPNKLPKLIKTQGSHEGDNVNCSLQDKAGNIWFGTTGEGLYKYDGKSFTQFTIKNGLKSNQVHYILEDKDGQIWIGTAMGVCLYKDKNFVEFQIPQPKNPTSSRRNVFSIMQDRNGKLWFATVNGVYIYDGQSFTTFVVNEGGKGFLSQKNNVEYILEDQEGNIWFGGRGNKGVFRYDGKSITNLQLRSYNGFSPTLQDNDSWAWPVLQDKNGDIWFCNWNGVYRYNGYSFTTFTKKDGLASNSVARIIEDKNGYLWFGCGAENNEICRYDGQSFTCLAITNGPRQKGIWSLLEDKTGNLWVGTRNTGLYRYDGTTFTNFSEK
ncbi:hypothetical protein BKI52_30340 [marine bacterium AO1-C]|nr:hypothetical protein BKI52_30340 [marine bacterium AO1-C]